MIGHLNSACEYSIAGKKNASEIAPANVQWQVALDIAYNSGFIIITNLRWTVN